MQKEVNKFDGSSAAFSTFFQASIYELWCITCSTQGLLHGALLVVPAVPLLFFLFLPAWVLLNYILQTF